MSSKNVYSWAIHNDFDQKSRDFVKLYSGQWPEGS